MKKRLLLAIAILAVGALAACAGSKASEENDKAKAVAETENGEATKAEALEATKAEAEATGKVKDKDADSGVTSDSKENAVENGTSKAESKENSTEEKSKVASQTEKTDAVAAAKPEVAFANITEISPAKKMYAKSSVNVRKGPSVEYDKVGHLNINQEISVIGRDKEGWYEFEQKGAKVFVSDLYLSETPVDLNVLAAATSAANQTAAATSAANQTAAATSAANQTETSAPVAPVTAPAGVLFIGDSRCVQMRDVTAGGGCTWICRNGAGYKWFEETAIPQADAIVGKGTKVVICLGVNDPGNVSNYAALANAKALEWAARGAKTYYVSVNPVWENPYTSQEQVNTFNASIVGQLAGIRWIDTHSYLNGAGYKLVDGLHYDDNTNLSVFYAILGSL